MSQRPPITELDVGPVSRRATSRKRLWIVLTVLLVLLGAFWVLRPWRDEPVHQGRPASYWLRKAAWGGNPQAWQALYQMGPDAAPYLLRMIKRDQDSWIRQRAFQLWFKLPTSLQNMVPPPVSAGELRITAVAVLDEIAPRATPPLSAILPLVSDENQIVRIHAFSLLSKLGPEAKASIPTLIGILKSAQVEDQDRSSAAWVLGEIGIVDRSAVAAALREAIANIPDPAFHVHAATALWKVDRQTNAAVQVLSRSLSNLLSSPWGMGPEGHMRGIATMRALETLTQIGPAAAEAVPVLTNAVHHSSVPIQTNAIEALRRIVPESVKALRPD